MKKRRIGTTCAAVVCGAAVAAVAVRTGFGADPDKRLLVPRRPVKALIKRGVSAAAKKKLKTAADKEATAKQKAAEGQALARHKAFAKATAKNRAAFEKALKRQAAYRQYLTKRSALDAKLAAALKKRDADKKKAFKDHVRAVGLLSRTYGAMRAPALSQSKIDRRAVVGRLAAMLGQKTPVILTPQIALVTVDPAGSPPPQTAFKIEPEYAEKYLRESTAYAGDKTTSLTCHKRTGYVDAESTTNAPVLSLDKHAGAWSSGTFEDYFTVPEGFGGVRVTAKVVVNRYSVFADGGPIGEAWAMVRAEITVRSNTRNFTYDNERSAQVSAGWCANESKSGAETWYPSIHVPLYTSGDELLIRVKVGTATTSWRGGSSSAAIDAHVKEIAIELQPPVP